MAGDNQGHDSGRIDTEESELRSRLAGLTSFQRDLLWVLSHKGPTKDVMVKHELAAYYGTSVNLSRIQPNLDALEECGLVDHRQKDDGTDEYCLTERGHRELERRRAWLAVGNEVE